MLTLILLLSLQTPRVEVQQQAYMVWDHKCIKGLKPSENMFIDAPLINGEPDMKHAKIEGGGVLVDYEVQCGHVEIRKEPAQK
jgi:hypothetical protein